MSETLEMKKIAAGIVATALCLLSSTASRAEDAGSFPSKPVRIVVTTSAGASSDMLTRTVARELSEIWGQQVVVENIPGASGNIGLKNVADADADGYTLVANGSGLTINANLYSDLGFDPATAFAGISQAVSNPQILVVRPDLGVKNFAEYVALAKEKNGELLFGLPGPGGIAHLANALISQRTDTKVTYVPYKGGAPAAADLLGGHTDAIIITLAAVTEHVRAGRLIPIAVTTAERSKALPDVPTLQEVGLDNFDLGSWQGFLAPAGTPQPIVEKIGADIVKALNDPEVHTFLEDQGYRITAATPAETDALVKREIVTFGEIIRSANITVED